jgi:hypothetical protein
MVGAKVVVKSEVRVSCPVGLCFRALRRFTRSRGTWRGSRIPGTLRDGRRRALETERLSLWELSKGHLDGGLLY